MKQYRNDDSFSFDGNKLTFSVADCLNYTFGDLINNTNRGAVAEFIVAKALGINTDIPRKDWLDYDLNYNGVKIEVKASGYIQSWNEDNDFISNIKYSIKPSKDYDDDHRMFSGDRRRKSDLYIFCLLTEKSKDKVDATDLNQWVFYAVQTAQINEKCGSHSSITLSQLKSIFHVKELNFYNLKTEVDKLL
jgi:hypothetical protein